MVGSNGKGQLGQEDVGEFEGEKSHLTYLSVISDGVDAQGRRSWASLVSASPMLRCRSPREAPCPTLCFPPLSPISRSPPSNKHLLRGHNSLAHAVRALPFE